MKPFAEVFPAENISIVLFGGIYIKEMRIPRGFVMVSHRHTFDHISRLDIGEVFITIDGVETFFRAPAYIKIKAGEEHMLRAVSDVVWLCIHATSVVDADAVEPSLIGVG